MPSTGSGLENVTAGSPAVTVGVFPAAERDGRRTLLEALEAAFPVRFVGRGPAEFRDLGGVLDFGDGDQAATAASVGIAALSLLATEPDEDGAMAVQALVESAELDRRLHGATLPDSRLGAALRAGGGLVPPAGTTVLASHGGEPTWVRAGALRTALLSPRELGAEEALRERLCDGRSAALLPLVHFLRELTAPIAWRPPPARASLLFDDPNLHWPSYGSVKLGALSAHARAHGYHAALATIPLDAWFAHPAAVRALKESEGAVSLAVHGNDHYGGELGRVRTEAEAVGLASQALRRVRAFARRTGVRVDPVMVPPHEECSEATVGGLRRCGFEGITMTRPFPWQAQSPHSWLARPAGVGPLVGWRPADLADGLPVLLRHPIVGRSLAELRLRAFLDQPLILYGHQSDLLGGLDLLAGAVADVNRVGETRWCSLGEIAGASFETRLDGSRLAVQLLTRRARVEIPSTAEELVVEGPAGDHRRSSERLLIAGQPQQPGEPVSVAPGATVEIELRDRDEVDIRSVAPPRRQPLALPRRALSEGRDRLLPLVSRSR